MGGRGRGGVGGGDGSGSGGCGEGNGFGSGGIGSGSGPGRSISVLNHHFIVSMPSFYQTLLSLTPGRFPSRMRKKAASGVLAGYCRLTISAAFTGVPCLIRHGVNLRGSTYRRARAASAARGGPGEMTTPRLLRHWALTGHRPLTISRAFTNVPHLIRCGVNLAPVRRREGIRTLPAHRLAGAHRRGALYSSRRAPHYSSPRGPRCGLVRCNARLGAQGWVGENKAIFAHPAAVSVLSNLNIRDGYRGQNEATMNERGLALKSRRPFFRALFWRRHRRSAIARAMAGRMGWGASSFSSRSSNTTRS